MGTGSAFQNENSPEVMVQVGTPGESGVIEISDMLFTVKGPTAGAILMEWNVHQSSQGSGTYPENFESFGPFKGLKLIGFVAAMWDSHFRVGGASGTNLQLADCPAGASSVNSNCTAASLLMHVTSSASAYFENVWAWVADHDLGQSTQRTRLREHRGDTAQCSNRHFCIRWSGHAHRVSRPYLVIRIGV